MQQHWKTTQAGRCAQPTSHTTLNTRCTHRHITRPLQSVTAVQPSTGSSLRESTACPKRTPAGILGEEHTWCRASGPLHITQRTQRGRAASPHQSTLPEMGVSVASKARLQLPPRKLGTLPAYKALETTTGTSCSCHRRPAPLTAGGLPCGKPPPASEGMHVRPWTPAGRATSSARDPLTRTGHAYDTCVWPAVGGCSLTATVTAGCTTRTGRGSQLQATPFLHGDPLLRPDRRHHRCPTPGQLHQYGLEVCQSEFP
jgi:hypothetical protein